MLHRPRWVSVALAPLLVAALLVRVLSPALTADATPTATSGPGSLILVFGRRVGLWHSGRRAPARRSTPSSVQPDGKIVVGYVATRHRGRSDIHRLTAERPDDPDWAGNTAYVWPAVDTPGDSPQRRARTGPGRAARMSPPRSPTAAHPTGRRAAAHDGRRSRRVLGTTRGCAPFESRGELATTTARPWSSTQLPVASTSGCGTGPPGRRSVQHRLRACSRFTSPVATATPASVRVAWHHGLQRVQRHRPRHRADARRGLSSPSATSATTDRRPGRALALHPNGSTVRAGFGNEGDFRLAEFDVPTAGRRCTLGRRRPGRRRDLPLGPLRDRRLPRRRRRPDQ